MLHTHGLAWLGLHDKEPNRLAPAEQQTYLAAAQRHSIACFLITCTLGTSAGLCGLISEKGNLTTCNLANTRMQQASRQKCDLEEEAYTCNKLKAGQVIAKATTVLETDVEAFLGIRGC